jgi:CRISPR/Cas system endoribonuclease Cas6 (RAMP superfamily)
VVKFLNDRVSLKFLISEIIHTVYVTESKTLQRRFETEHNYYVFNCLNCLCPLSKYYKRQHFETLSVILLLTSDKKGGDIKFRSSITDLSSYRPVLNEVSICMFSSHIKMLFKTEFG